jgi:methionyl-tRNA formyltransferase
MKIEFLTDDNPLYVLPFFEEFFLSYSSEFEVLQVSSCRPMGRRARVRLLKDLAYLYGPIGILRLITRWSVSRLLGALPRKRGAKEYHTLRQLCAAYSVPFKRIENPNSPALVADAVSRQADLLVSIACPYILKEALLKTPRLGCVNMHHATLPRYKGMMPTFWQMYHGERRVGITIHTMTARVDEGQALFQGQMDIEPGESLHHLIRRAKRHGAHCMARVLREIQSQTQRTTTLDSSTQSYFSFPTLDEIREFRRKGLRAI